MRFLIVKHKLLLLCGAIVCILVFMQDRYALFNLFRTGPIRSRQYLADTEQHQRKQLLREQCERLNTPVKAQIGFDSPLYINDAKHKMFMCVLPKAGTTFWHRIFYILSEKGGITSTDKCGIFEQSVSQQKGPFRISNNTTRVMFARHPYSRLYSAYVSKLVEPNYYYWQEFGAYITKHIRKGANEKSRRCGHDVTFAEFVRYVIGQFRLNNEPDVHIMPASQFCDACGTPYNFIGKLETFKQDTKHILKNLKPQQNVTNAAVTAYLDNTLLIELECAVRGTIREYYSHSWMTKCLTEAELMSRIWYSLQLRGIISSSLPWADVFLEVPKPDDTALPSILTKAIQISKNKTQLRLYKEKEFQKAYVSLSEKDRLRLKKLYENDFKIFGYDPNTFDVVA